MKTTKIYSRAGLSLRRATGGFIMKCDSTAREKLLNGKTQRLQAPASVISDFWRRADSQLPGAGCARDIRRRSEKKTALKQLPVRIYKYRKGYEFSWGQIIERRQYNLVIWEIVYDRLLRRMHWYRLGLPEIQRVAFEFLLEHESRFQADPWRALDIPGRFIITPGTVYDAWSVTSHFCAENAARQWLYQALGPGGRVGQVAQAIVRRYLATDDLT